MILHHVLFCPICTAKCVFTIYSVAKVVYFYLALFGFLPALTIPFAALPVIKLKLFLSSSQ
jgi:hypothetical protein